MPLRNPLDPLTIVLFTSDPGGIGNVKLLREMDMPTVGAVPAVGDFIYERNAGYAPVAYRVTARHFDPAHNRVGVMLVKVDAVANSPFV